MRPAYEHAKSVASSRLKSQDLVGVFERDEFLVVVIADGGGGMRGGEAASRCLVSVVGAAVDDHAFALGQTRPWIDLFKETDLALATNRAGETTGVVVVLGPRGLVGVSAGDSEAWIIAPSVVDNLTVGRQSKARLGSNRVTPAAFERTSLGGVLLVASDGLFKYASTEVIARIVRDDAIGAAADHLVDLVRLRSGKVTDDVAVVLVSRSGKPGAPDRLG
jgi:serine/threonine protein phosphatase PrpC